MERCAIIQSQPLSFAEEKVDSMFIPDTPISSATEDTLGRRNFAEKLGATIRDWDRTESIVIALYGPWGSGKTSVLNMAVSYIEDTTKDPSKGTQPIIVRFNPWNFSGQEQLLRAFFREVLAAIRKVMPSKAEDLQKLLNGFARILGALEKVPVAGDIASTGGRVIGVLASDEMPLEDLRKKISGLFESLDRRIVIVLDDIDRLTQEEIRQIFKLIKINADFPNTIYLVAFDRGVVEKALTSEQGVFGREYLEKIVQVGFNIPAVDPAFIAEMLFREMTKNLSSIQLSNHWDSTRWGNLYHSGFKLLFKSIRDVKRFVNSLAFNLRVVSGEINPIDFIGLEALRVFAPEVYEGIANNKALFTSVSGRWGSQLDQAELKKQYELIFSRAGERLSSIVANICQQLFPQMKWAYENMTYSPGWETTWRKERRICAGDIFDVYFLLGTPKGDVSQAELQQIAAVANEPTKLLAIFDEIQQSGRIARLLTLLDDVLSEIKEPGILGLSEALLVLGDRLPNEQRGFLDFGTDLQILGLEYRALIKLDKDRCCDWLQNQIANGPSFYTVIRLVAMDDHEEGKVRESPLIDETCLENLKEKCVQAIIAQVQQGQIGSVKNLALVLVYWLQWAKDRESLDAFVAQQTSTQEGLIDFIQNFVQQSHSVTAGDYVSRLFWNIDLNALKLLVSLERLSVLVSSLSEGDFEQMSENRKIAIRTLRDALNSKKKGGGTDEDAFEASD
jgi:predicted KAP-like P-loop ATPase